RGYIDTRRALRLAGQTSALALVIAACGREHRRAVAADGKEHYSAYAAGGEVTDAFGRVNIYGRTGANELSPIAARARPLVYVPNSLSGTVSVIDPKTYQVINTFKTGKVPQHVVPSYDLT